MSYSDLYSHNILTAAARQPMNNPLIIYYSNLGLNMYYKSDMYVTTDAGVPEGGVYSSSTSSSSTYKYVDSTKSFSDGKEYRKLNSTVLPHTAHQTKYFTAWLSLPKNATKLIFRSDQAPGSSSGTNGSLKLTRVEINHGTGSFAGKPTGDSNIPWASLYPSETISRNSGYESGLQITYASGINDRNVTNGTNNSVALKDYLFGPPEEGDEADSIAETALASATTDTARKTAISSALENDVPTYSSDSVAVRKRKQIKFRKRALKKFIAELANKAGDETIAADQIFKEDERTFDMTADQKAELLKPRKIREANVVSISDSDTAAAKKTTLKAKATALITTDTTFEAGAFPDDLYWPLETVGDCFAVKIEGEEIIFRIVSEDTTANTVTYGMQRGDDDEVIYDAQSTDAVTRKVVTITNPFLFPGNTDYVFYLGGGSSGGSEGGSSGGSGDPFFVPMFA